MNPSNKNEACQGAQKKKPAVLVFPWSTVFLLEFLFLLLVTNWSWFISNFQIQKPYFKKVSLFLFFFLIYVKFI